MAAPWPAALLRKPLELSISESHVEGKHVLKRHLRLFDLICIGIGATVGTGIFALTGQIAAENAGPAVGLSWAIAGIGCLLNGVAYMELATGIPTVGSTYAYAYICLGELPAYIAAWCLTLEYGVSGSAVARAWSSKVARWVLSVKSDASNVTDAITYPYGDLAAGIIQLFCILVLYYGVSLGTRTVNIVTVSKVLLIVFMTVAGFVFFNADNLADGFPPPQQGNKFGWNGVLLGSTHAFFGYIGFDEVSCMAGEAVNPAAMHKAVVGTILGTGLLSIVSAFALVGMESYLKLDPVSAFGYAFNSNGAIWAGQITQVGEILTLPVVVLISFMAQPRLQYALAIDGLLPSSFGIVDQHGNPKQAIIYGGLFCLSLTLFVPFTHLESLISGGVLISFMIANASLIMFRHMESKSELQLQMKTLKYISVFTAASGVLALVLFKTNINESAASLAVISIAAVVLLVCAVRLVQTMPSYVQSKSSFAAPFVPITPLLSIFVDWIMLSQLPPIGLYSVLGYTGAVICLYFAYSSRHSVGQHQGWHKELRYNDMLHLCACSSCYEESPPDGLQQPLINA